jgi:GntR family transcriptional regulator
MVASGQLTPGTELPSVREIATEYTLNPTTISKA